MARIHLYLTKILLCISTVNVILIRVSAADISTPEGHEHSMIEIENRETESEDLYDDNMYKAHTPLPVLDCCPQTKVRTEEKSTPTSQYQHSTLTWSCPHKCWCPRKHAVLTVDCNKKKLKAVPAGIPLNVNVLILSNNHIREIQNDSFANFENLTKLLLDNNEIKIISKYAFQGLKKLCLLDLTSNKIERIRNGTLNQLISLSCLSLGKNSLSALGPQQFLGLDNLISLNLSKNHFRHIPNFAFKGKISLPNLVNLDVRGNKISRFGLHSMKGLQGLDVSGNRLELRDNQFSEVKNLSHLHMANCGLTFLSGNLFEGLLKLKQLLLSNNRLKQLEEGLFSPLKSLETLFLINTSLTNFNVSSYGILPELTTLLLQKNLINEFPEFKKRNTISSVPKLKTLNFDKNAIEILPSTIFPVPSLEILILSRNRFESLGASAMKAFPKIKKIQLSYNIPLKYIDQNAFESETLENIDISETGTKKDFMDLFSRTPNLQVLNISYSSVYYSSALTNLPNLRVLVAKKIGLGEISTMNLTNTTNIEELDISNNFIKDVNRSFLEPLKNLKKLKLNNNIISVINQTTLPKFYWTNLTSLDVSNNPFNCECDLLWFRKLIKNSSRPIIVKSKNKNFYRCTAPTKFKSTPLKELKEPTTLQCFSSSDEVWTISVILTCVTIFGLVTAILAGLHKHRWHVRYWKYIVLARRRRQKDFESSLELPYDAFIAYSQSDSWWVTEQLLPHLTDPEDDSDSGLRLCVHHRDWLAGRDILDNIVDSIESSRKTVLVVSNAFARSDWCHKELTLAQSRLFQDEGNNLVIILLESLDYSFVYPRLKYEMDRRTYIEWPRDSLVGQELFWMKLKEAIQVSQPTV